MRGSYFFILLIAFACSKNKDFEQIKVIGHAATGLEMSNSVYHDNTKEAVEFALSIEGCEGVEIDIQLSQDGNLWLYHDEKLQTQTNGEGCINDQTSQALDQVNYSTTANEKLTALEELDLSIFKGKEMLLDLRHYSACSPDFVDVSSVIEKLTALNLKTPTNFNVTCIISNSQWIQPFLTEGFQVYYSIYSQDEFEKYESLFPGITGYIVKNADFTKDEVQMIKNSGKKVYIFEMRSPKGIRKALRKYPDGVVTDDIRATLIEKY
jgi:glycerophosphoryl diester phosphodiesterase